MKIKNITWSIMLALGMLSTSYAQKIAIIDVNSIMEELPEYQDAQRQLDEQAATWRQEIAAQYDEIKAMYNKFQAEQVLLSPSAKAEREDAIIKKEDEVRQLQKRRFGAEGMLFERRKQLVRPIQDKVFTAIEEFANLQDYDLIFDKSSNAGLIFLNDDYDKTEEVARLVD